MVKKQIKILEEFKLRKITHEVFPKFRRPTAKIHVAIFFGTKCHFITNIILHTAFPPLQNKCFKVLNAIK